MSEIYEQARAWFEANWDPDRPVGEWWELLAGSGYGFPHWPQGRFGLGLDHAGSAEVDRARADCAAFGPPNGIGPTLVAPTLFAHGPELLTDRYLADIATGRELWCQLFSEPGAGSDLAGLATRAVRDGDRWIVNGQKVWTSGGHLARRAVLMARTDPAVTKHRGITFFAIDLDQPGVEVRPLRDMTGDREFNEVFLSDAEVRADDVLGELNDGWRVAMTMLAVERDLDAVGHDGGGDVIHDVDLAEPAGRVQHGQRHGSLSGFSYTTGSLKDEVTAELVASSLAARPPAPAVAAVLRERRVDAWARRWLLDANGARQVHASVAKNHNAELCRQLRDLGFVAGGLHATLSGPDAVDGGHFLKMALFTQGMSLAGGTDQVQRNIVGERVLGLPKEPDPGRDLPFNAVPGR